VQVPSASRTASSGSFSGGGPMGMGRTRLLWRIRWMGRRIWRMEKTLVETKTLGMGPTLGGIWRMGRMVDHPSTTHFFATPLLYILRLPAINGYSLF
ncbi:hypothetical protein PENTCL1PPCAC_2626, partial [Pristionchus entomophagus]